MDNMHYKIVMVDDNLANLTIGRNLLKHHYEVYPAASAAKLFEILKNIMPDLVLLDIEMPEMNGYEAITVMKSDTRLADIPVIFLTVKNEEVSEMQGFDLGAVDYITKPFSAPLLLKRIENQLLIVEQKRDLIKSREALKDYADSQDMKAREKTTEALNLRNALFAAVSDLAEFRGQPSGRRAGRTPDYLKALIDELLRAGIYADEISAWDMDVFLPSAQLHDIGKIAVSDTILGKPDRLSADEFEVVKSHVPAGVSIIQRVMSEIGEQPYLRYAALIAGSHHERWDGSGYPLGLKGGDIPPEGQLMAIADVYDALISDRPYRKAYSHEEACEIMEKSAGSHFNPMLIDLFRNVKATFRQIAQK